MTSRTSCGEEHALHSILKLQNSLPLKNDGWKMTFLLGLPIFLGAMLNFRGVLPLKNTAGTCRSSFEEKNIGKSDQIRKVPWWLLGMDPLVLLSPLECYLDVPVEVRIKGSDQWYLQPKLIPHL